MEKTDKKHWYDLIVSVIAEPRESISQKSSDSYLPNAPLPVLEEWGSLEERAA